jgi:hypothetical protein
MGTEGCELLGWRGIRRFETEWRFLEKAGMARGLRQGWF